MFNRRITAGLLSGVVAVGLVLSAQTASAIKAQEAAKLEADAKATLAKFQTSTKGSQEVFANAKGILVCPKITKGGFIVGVESGNCVLTKGAPKPLYYGTSAHASEHSGFAPGPGYLVAPGVTRRRFS